MIKHKGEVASSELTIPPGKVITVPVAMKKGDQIVDVHTGKVLATATRDVSPAPVVAPTSTPTQTATSVPTSSTSGTPGKSTSPSKGSSSSPSHSTWGASKTSGPLIQTDYVGTSTHSSLLSYVLAVIFAIFGGIMLGWDMISKVARKGK